MTASITRFKDIPWTSPAIPDDLPDDLRGARPRRCDGSGSEVAVANDAISIPAGQVYGFEVGAEGVRFLLMRGAVAQSTIAGSGS